MDLIAIEGFYFRTFFLIKKVRKKSRQKNAALHTFQPTPAFLPGQRTRASQCRYDFNQ
jgi:hypothetical protein